MPLFRNRRSDSEMREQPPPGKDASPQQAVPNPSVLPPHMQRIIDERGRRRDQPQDAKEAQRASFERRRMDIQYDIDQGEMAIAPDNPWQHRIELLTQALEDVEVELREKEQVVPGPFYQLPPTPLEGLEVESKEPFRVSFLIGNERFTWQEELDWAERGGMIAEPTFIREAGNVAALVPEDTPDYLLQPLITHLTDSLFTLATDIRDRLLDDETLPHDVTLADLALPCPICGGWTDWKGHCNTCANRKAANQALFQERQRLSNERAGEYEERHRLSERLPLARRRMHQLEQDYAQWQRRHEE